MFVYPCHIDKGGKSSYSFHSHSHAKVKTIAEIHYLSDLQQFFFFFYLSTSYRAIRFKMNSDITRNIARRSVEEEDLAHLQ